jgi:hypothetical protein
MLALLVPGPLAEALAEAFPFGVEVDTLTS